VWVLSERHSRCGYQVRNAECRYCFVLFSVPLFSNSLRWLALASYLPYKETPIPGVTWEPVGRLFFSFKRSLTFKQERVTHLIRRCRRSNEGKPRAIPVAPATIKFFHVERVLTERHMRGLRMSVNLSVFSVFPVYSGLPFHKSHSMSVATFPLQEVAFVFLLCGYSETRRDWRSIVFDWYTCFRSSIFFCLASTDTTFHHLF
jgi:hypothetical protein